MDRDRTEPGATRMVVISDLHLGGVGKPLMSRPAALTAFLDKLPSTLSSDESLELVVAGDFIDFLALTPHAAFTASPKEACRKLEQVGAAGSSFAPVLDALGRLVAGRHRLTILTGNHDLELLIPQVRSAFLRRIGATPHQVLFVDEDRAHRVGRALIEHGNRYDGANENDWRGLQELSSALSRGEIPRSDVRPSAGSSLVEKVVNPIKARYPFIDQLQPEGEIVALLLVAFEPILLVQLRTLARILRAERRSRRNQNGLPPGELRLVSDDGPDERDEELAQAFGKAYEVIRATDEQVGFMDVVSIAWAFKDDSLANILDRGAPIPRDRLEQIRVALRKMLADDRTNRLDGPTGQYGSAAQRMIDEGRGDVETVVMGHTHQARHVGPEERATYINTGTWADVVRVPENLLGPFGAEAERRDADKGLTEVLRRLKADERTPLPPSYASLRIERGGRVSQARALRFGGE